MSKETQLGKLPSICAGTAALGDMPVDFGFSIPEKEALGTIEALLTGPIKFMDSAPFYGKSEERIGQAIQRLGGLPEGYIIATKADRDPVTGDFSADQVRHSVMGSLGRLNLQQLSIVYLHDPEHSPQISFEEFMSPDGPVDALEELKEEDIINHIGIAGGPIDLMTKFIETGRFEVMITHNRYTLLYRTAKPLIKLANQSGVLVVNAAPYGSGLLATGASVKNPRYAYRKALEEEITRVGKMEKLCRSYNVPLAAAALQFSVNDPQIDSTIVGITSPEQIKKTFEFLKYPIPQDLWSKLADLAIYEGDPEAVNQ